MNKPARHRGGDQRNKETRIMTAPAVDDPFASSEKSPAISFKDKPIGTVITIKVTESPKKIQGKEFGTDNLAVWRNKDGTTSPKYSAVINGTCDGEPCSIWAQIPSDLFAKLKDAQAKLGRSVRDGDVIDIKLENREPTAGSPKNVHAVRITPGTPSAPAGSDPFASDTPAASGNVLGAQGNPNGFPDEVPPW